MNPRKLGNLRIACNSHKQGEPNIDLKILKSLLYGIWPCLAAETSASPKHHKTMRAGRGNIIAFIAIIVFQPTS